MSWRTFNLDKDEPKPWTQAETTIADQMAKWPTLYRDEYSFFNTCVVSTTGSFEWEKGVLVSKDDVIWDNEKKAYVPTPRRMPIEIAHDLMGDRFGRIVHTFNMPCSKSCPMENIPDDIEDSWKDYLGSMLWHYNKQTPKLYDKLIDAMYLAQYGGENRNAPSSRYKDEYRTFYKRIPTYQARIRLIDETRRLGQIPVDTYQGIDI